MFIIPDLLDKSALQMLLSLLDKVQFVDGSYSGEGSAYQKKNLQAVSPEEIVRQASKAVHDTLLANAKFRVLALPRRVRPPIFNRHEPGMYYRDHTDAALLPGNPTVRGDLSVTVFLSRPEDYAGGELVVDTDGPRATAVKLPAGHAVVYPATTMHRVNPVTTGARTCAITTVESLVQDWVQRELIGEMAQLLRWVQDTAPQSAEERMAGKIYGNLLRMWART